MFMCQIFHYLTSQIILKEQKDSVETSPTGSLKTTAWLQIPKRIIIEKYFFIYFGEVKSLIKSLIFVNEY